MIADLRRLRRKAEAAGLGAVVGPRQGKVTQVAPEVRAAWCAMFDAGQTPTAAHREQPRKTAHAYSTVREGYVQWKQAPPAAPVPAPASIEVPLMRAAQLTLWQASTPAIAVEESVPPDEGRADIASRRRRDRRCCAPRVCRPRAGCASCSAG